MSRSMDSQERGKEQNTNDNHTKTDPFAELQREMSAAEVRIRDVNDRLRTTGRGGMVVMTNGVGALGLEKVNAIFAAIASFAEFTPDNDPWGQHDCAILAVDGIRIIWKIDYYDRSRRIHSPDPSDPKVTVRVMTVMLAEEY